MPVTGDLKKHGAYKEYAGQINHASAFPYTIVPKADLIDPNSPVNQTYLSGKTRGAGIIAEESDGSLVLYLASGDSPTDAWLNAGGTDEVAI